MRPLAMPGLPVAACSRFRGCATCKPKSCSAIDRDVLKSSTPRASTTGRWRRKGQGPVCGQKGKEDEGEWGRSGVRGGCAWYGWRTYCEAGPPSDATLRLARPPAPHPDGSLRLTFASPWKLGRWGGTLGEGTARVKHRLGNQHAPGH